MLVGVEMEVMTLMKAIYGAIRTSDVHENFSAGIQSIYYF